QFQSTRSGDILGSAVIQPLPATDSFEVVVSREGSEQKLTVQRDALVPILGAQLDERDNGVVVTRVGGGVAAASGLEDGDRIVSVAGRDVSNRGELFEALRALNDGEDPITSVTYLV